MTRPRDITSHQAKTQAWLYITMAILFIPLVVTVYISVSDSDIATLALPDPACDLQRGVCQSVFASGGKVSLSITPRPITALKPLHIQVQLEGIRAQSVEVDFRGVNMNMGYNRPQLHATAPGLYTGTWVLASCGLERMVWEATVILETNGQKMAARFPLVTAHR